MTTTSSTRHGAWAAGLLALLVLPAACSGTSDTSGNDSADNQAPVATEVAAVEPGDADRCPTEGQEWETAKVYIEHNSTDADTGFHGLVGGEAWQELCLFDPDGNLVLLADPQNQLGDLAVADLFFESREPPNDEYSPEALMADFPEGTYTVAGTDFEGVARVGGATFTHDIPAPPTITVPAGIVADFEEEEPPTVPAEGLAVAWEPVTETIAGDPVEISGYEVIVTTEEFDDPDGNSQPIYDVHVGPDVTELAVPDAWLQPDTLYEMEVLALEVSGNQTISVGFFTTS